MYNPRFWTLEPAELCEGHTGEITALSCCCVMCAGGMVEFRRSLAASFLFRFFLLSSYKLAADSETFKPAFPDTFKSAVKVRSAILHTLPVSTHRSLIDLTQICVLLLWPVC